ncbi:MAG: zf-HC2 domain-containing protein [Pyrinomonadaceae bacterium]
MKCENLQFNLSIYLDDCLTGDERALVDEHLATCPLCRQKLADFQELRKSLRVLARPEIPNHVLNSVRSAVSAELNTTAPLFIFQDDSRGWLQTFLMPYSVGVVASLFFGFIVLSVLLSSADVTDRNTETASLIPKGKSTVMLANPPSNSNDDFIFDSNEYAINANDFANARISVSNESPSVNPTGALVALTKSIVRGEMKDEEVVVVADVFGNGLARIGEVIEQPRDAQTLSNLKNALENDPDYAPFVPASFDRRADSVQIVLKIQRVDVNVRKLNLKKKN